MSGRTTDWKTLLVKSAPELFNGSGHSDKDQAELIDQLYKKIGKLEVELDWLKKSLDLTVKEKRILIDWNQTTLS